MCFRWGARAQWFVVLTALVVMPVAAIGVIAGASGWSLASVIVAAVVAAVAMRSARLEVRASTARLEVRNPWRTYREETEQSRHARLRSATRLPRPPGYRPEVCLI